LQVAANGWVVAGVTNDPLESLAHASLWKNAAAFDATAIRPSHPENGATRLEG
jgi:hypothetical protein